MATIKVENILNDLGMNNTYKGYEYLVEGVKLCRKEKKFLVDTMDLYEEIAKESYTNFKAVERCIRYAIKSCDYNMLGFEEVPNNALFINAILNKLLTSKTKLYNVFLVPYGDLRQEMNPTLLGTFKTKEEAQKVALSEYEKDHKNFWVAMNQDLENFDDFLQVFWRYTENYVSYYELHILESEID